MTLEYDGSFFSGWQIQPNVRTIQGELVRALSVYSKSLAEVNLVASGRTDAGVHALAQVVSFPWPDDLEFVPSDFIHSVNGISDKAVQITSVETVEDEFDARKTAHRKCYQYRIIEGQRHSPLNENGALCISQKLDLKSMILAANQFVGTHDFSSFRASDCGAKTTTRTITHSEIQRISSDELVYTVCGNGFLKQMIRIIIGLLLDIGRHKRTYSEVLPLIEARDRTLLGSTAPASGLYLRWVKYE